MEYTTIRKMTTFKRRIDPDDELIHFIRHNSNKRRYMWNRYVEEYRSNPSDFDIGKTTTALIEEDIDRLLSPNSDSVISEMYCSDVIKYVGIDVKRALKIIDANKKKTGKASTLKYRSHDPFRKAFKICTRNTFLHYPNNPMGKVHFKNNHKFEFRASTEYVINRYTITLMEPITDEFCSETHEFINYDNATNLKRYSFHHDDIKEIVFMEELGKFYIMLVCKVTYYNYKNEMNRKKHLAGIDLGIHNPVTLYDGEKTVNIVMSPQEMSRIQYYERRCKKIQRGMDKKYTINKERHANDPSYPLYSRRYRKLQCRLRRYYKHISNIRANWRFKTCKVISRHYSVLVVDEFSTPDNRSLKACNKLKRYYNHYNRNHAMSLFTKLFKHTSEKNGCMYVKSPKYTTRTCSICGFVNEKLPLSERYLVCKSCGKAIDRDANAAMNCYDFYANTKTIDE